MQKQYNTKNNKEKMLNTREVKKLQEFDNNIQRFNDLNIPLKDIIFHFKPSIHVLIYLHLYDFHKF